MRRLGHVVLLHGEKVLEALRDALEGSLVRSGVRILDVIYLRNVDAELRHSSLVLPLVHIE